MSCFISNFYLKSYVDHRDLHSFPTRRSSDLRISRHADDAMPLTEQVERLGRLLGQAHDPPRIRPVHAIPADASVRSANTNPSRSMMTPVSTGIGRLNIGPR